MRTITPPAPVRRFLENEQRSMIRIRHVAALVGLSPRTIRREVLSGELPATKIGRRNGGDYFVSYDDAAAYICRVLGLPPLPALER
jgi:excisionase family DNA binding protein